MIKLHKVEVSRVESHMGTQWVGIQILSGTTLAVTSDGPRGVVYQKETKRWYCARIEADGSYFELDVNCRTRDFVVSALVNYQRPTAK